LPQTPIIQGKIMSESVKYLLPEDRIPRAWYNIAADLPAPPPPPLHPGTRQPIGPDDLAAIFRWR
jgi:tryptophan synthase beta chain